MIFFEINSVFDNYKRFSINTPVPNFPLTSHSEVTEDVRIDVSAIMQIHHKFKAIVKELHVETVLALGTFLNLLCSEVGYLFDPITQITIHFNFNCSIHFFFVLMLQRYNEFLRLPNFQC